MIETFSNISLSKQVPFMQAAREITAMLADLKLEPVEGYLLNEGLLRIDVAIPGNKIALTLETSDGYACNAPKQPLGSTVLEWRLLSCREWQVTPNAFPIPTPSLFAHTTWIWVWVTKSRRGE